MGDRFYPKANYILEREINLEKDGLVTANEKVSLRSGKFALMKPWRLILADVGENGFYGFYPDFTDTPKKNDNSRGGVSCNNAENTQMSSKKKRLY